MPHVERLTLSESDIGCFEVSPPCSGHKGYVNALSVETFMEMTSRPIDEIRERLGYMYWTRQAAEKRLEKLRQGQIERLRQQMEWLESE